MSGQAEYLKAIADAIRFKDGTTEPIPANTFLRRILDLPVGKAVTAYTLPTPTTQTEWLTALAGVLRAKAGTTDAIPAKDFPARILALEAEAPPTPSVYTVEILMPTSGVGAVTGAGEYESGSSVTVSASANDGYRFKGWEIGGASVGTDANYTFVIDRDVTITAKYVELVAGIAHHKYLGSLSSYGFATVPVCASNSAIALFCHASTDYTSTNAGIIINTSLTISQKVNGYYRQSAGGTLNDYAVLAGGLRYSTGSHTWSVTTDAKKYNKSGTASSLFSLSKARDNLAGANTKGHLLFAGGHDGSAYCGDVDAYDTSFSHTALEALGTARSCLVGGTVSGKAVFAGGVNGKILDAVDAYDESLTHHVLTPMSSIKRYHSAAACGTYILFAGGYTNPTFLDAVDVYDENLTRVSILHLSAAKYNMGGVPLAGNAVFCGGFLGDSQYTDVVEVFDKHLTKTMPCTIEKSCSGIACTVLGDYAVLATKSIADTLTVGYQEIPLN